MRRHMESLIIAAALSAFMLLLAAFASLRYVLCFKRNGQYMQSYPYTALNFLVVALLILIFELTCRTFLGYAFLVLLSIVKMGMYTSAILEFQYLWHAPIVQDLAGHIRQIKHTVPQIVFVCNTQHYFVQLVSCQDQTEPLDLPFYPNRKSVVFVSFNKEISGDRGNLQILHDLKDSLRDQFQSGDVRVFSSYFGIGSRAIFAESLPWWFSLQVLYFSTFLHIDLAVLCLFRTAYVKRQLVIQKHVRLSRQLHSALSELSDIQVTIKHRQAIRYGNKSVGQNLRLLDDFDQYT